MWLLNRMLRKVITAAALLGCAGLAMAGGGPPWMKWDRAKSTALATGDAILVYSNVDADGGGC